MANILLNNYCNQKCPYCFAEEVIQEKSYNTTLKEFKKIYEWLKKTNEETIGLIGGEPTLNPNFPEILTFLLEESLMQVLIYTNGTTDLEPYINLCYNCYFLINVNSPIYVGEKNYKNTLNTIKLLNNNKINFTIGITLFPEIKDYEYIFKIAKENNLKGIRVSYASPNYKTNKHEYYLKGKELFYNFCQMAKQYNIEIFMDCNKVPSCYFSEEENDFINTILVPNTTTLQDYCLPVIDIDHNGNATTCFGGGKGTKINIFEFKNIVDLQRYFYINDMYEKMLHNNDGKCSDCDRFKKKICQGGCLAFSDYK